MKGLIIFILCFYSINLVGQDGGINVYIAVEENCPICIYMSEFLEETEVRFKEKAKFYLVFASKRSNYKTINKFKKQYGLTKFESILDKKQVLVKRLQLSVTPEVAITDDSGNILYRGRINDAYSKPGRKKMTHPTNDLDINLINIINNIPNPQPWPIAIGCFITIAS